MIPLAAELPIWFKQEIPDTALYAKQKMLSQFKVHTVCKEAHCPNLSACFGNSELTFMILGDTCTRNCRFCAVDKSPQPFLGVDNNEPYEISRWLGSWGLGMW